MSWSLSVGPVAIEELDAAVDAATVQTTPNYGVAEQQEQVAVAKQAISMIAHSGALGAADTHPGLRIGANASGHANPDHVPTGDWASDTINVNVYAAKPMA